MSSLTRRRRDASAFTVDGVTKAFGATRAVDGVNLPVPHGSSPPSSGPSGCGKTTLLRLVAGFLAPDAGTHRASTTRVVAGDGVGRCRRSTRRVGYVPQEGALFPHLDVAAQHRASACRRESRRGTRRRPGRPRLLDLVELPAASASRRARTSSPAASSSGWRWPGRSPRSPRWCCSTSRSPPSTPACARSTAPGRAPGARTRPAPPPSWSPTTRTRRCRWPTRSR